MQKSLFHPSARRSLLLSLLLLPVVSVPAFGQSTHGAILGEVKDQTGSVVRGAAIAVTDTDTGVTRNTVTNDSGDYQVLDLTEGHYKVEVKASGFTSQQLSQLTLVARQHLRADVSLKVGASQEVSVSAEGAGAINTESASIDATYSAVDVESLPAN